MGADKIFIYDDSEPDSIEHGNFLLALEPFIQGGYVIRYEAPFKLDHFGDPVARQRRIYNHFLVAHRNEYDWVGYLDHDEFLMVHNALCFQDFLANYSEFGAVVAQWNLRAMFGVKEHDSSKSYLEQYRCPVPCDQPYVKLIVQPKHVVRMDVHDAEYVDGYFAVNSQKNRIDGPFNVAMNPPALAYEVIELRHFWYGDWKFLLFEKVCGLGNEREVARIPRIQIALHRLRANQCPVEDDRLPILFPQYRRSFFNLST